MTTGPTGRRRRTRSGRRIPRSEEHTSELQSLRHLVCRLLLEKKKAIDNSAGMNTSDVEVNIKIPLSVQVRDARLDDDGLNALLAAIPDEVAAVVLRNNELEKR